MPTTFLVLETSYPNLDFFEELPSTPDSTPQGWPGNFHRDSSGQTALMGPKTRLSLLASRLTQGQLWGGAQGLSLPASAGTGGTGERSFWASGFRILVTC